MPAEPIIDVQGLEKTFSVLRKAGRLRRRREDVVAVAGIDVRIDRGTMVGYIGPNGAGKSSTVKLLTGILVPTRGSVRVAGLDPSRRRIDFGGGTREGSALFEQRHDPQRAGD